jgi:hypothetical protein
MPGLPFERAIANVEALVAARDAAARLSSGADARKGRSPGADARDDAGGRRCRVSFQVTAQEGNVAELAGIVRLAARLGVDRVKVNQLQVRAPRLAALSLRRDAEAIRRWNAAVAEARSAAEEVRRASGAEVLLQNVAPLAEDPAAPAPAGPCPFVGREAWVHADGRFAPCPHPAAARGELGAFGSAAERPLLALWADPRFRAFVAGYESHPICRECPFRRMGGA